MKKVFQKSKKWQGRADRGTWDKKQKGQKKKSEVIKWQNEMFINNHIL